MKIELQKTSLIVIGLVLVSQVLAQSQALPRFTLKGAVTDTEGAVIEGTLVRIVRWGQDDKQRVVESEMAVHTDAKGQFKFELAPGIYDIFLSAAGFSPAAKQVKIEAGRETIVNTKLNVSRFLEGIRVTAP